MSKTTEEILTEFRERFVITNPRNEEDEGWVTGALPPNIEQFIREALERVREETLVSLLHKYEEVEEDCEENNFDPSTTNYHGILLGEIEQLKTNKLEK